MMITLYKKVVGEITTISDLELYIKNHIYVDFKCISEKFINDSVELLKKNPSISYS